ncbi:MAG: DUF6287 domain-containing protein [Streptococcaceae bacterium]|jgi:hypothetical protein|nr:DUF6287 domain-containing protein [Streptococcaceae bacterium]
MTNLDEKQNENFSTEQQHGPPELGNDGNEKKKKMSKKKKTVLAISISVGVLLGALGVFAFSQQGNAPTQTKAEAERVQEAPSHVEPENGIATPTPAPVPEANTPTAPTPEQPSTKFDLEAIKRGDFASLQGSWENEQFPDRNFVISGNTVTFANGNSAVHQIMVGTSHDGGVTFTLVIESGGISAAISIFPAGTSIPEWLVDGTDELGRHDLTDNSQDRLMIWQGLSTPEEILENIVYRA